MAATSAGRTPVGAAPGAITVKNVFVNRWITWPMAASMFATALVNASRSLSQAIGSQLEFDRMYPCRQPAPTHFAFSGPPLT